MSNFFETELVKVRTAWSTLVAQYKLDNAIKHRTFVDECIKSAENEIDARIQKVVDEFDAEMQKLEEDKKKPGARDFILTQREKSIRRRFDSSVKFLEDIRAITLEQLLKS